MTDKLEMHCVVELFGHQKIAGKVTEQTIAGTGFIRVDVPKTPKHDGFTRFYGPGAIYAMSPVTEEIATLIAERLEVEAVSEWTLQQALHDRLLAATATAVVHGPMDWTPREEDDDDKNWNLPDDDEDDGEEENTGNVVHFDVEPQYREAAEMPAGDIGYAHKDKRAAAAWARELLKGEFVIFDTETTSFDEKDQIIQIGIIDQTGAVVLERLIKPTIPVPNAEYHGITDEMLVNAPGFSEVHGQIKLALEGKRVLAYNEDYDIRMLDQDCARHHLKIIIPSSSDCVMEKYAQFNGEWNEYHGNYRWKKLREALAAFGLKHEDFGAKEHDACTDAKATLAVIKKMAEFEPEKPAAAEELSF